jgi:polyphosphate kinase 2 (PPK2 family)
MLSATHEDRDIEGMEMKINSKDFRVRPGKKVKLQEWPTMVKPYFKSKKRYQKLLEEHVEELSTLQQLHFASNRYALLLIFQGMDAGGKDGAVRHVMSGAQSGRLPGLEFQTAERRGTGA